MINHWEISLFDQGDVAQRMSANLNGQNLAIATNLHEITTLPLAFFFIVGPSHSLSY